MGAVGPGPPHGDAALHPEDQGAEGWDAMVWSAQSARPAATPCHDTTPPAAVIRCGEHGWEVLPVGQGLP